MWGSGPASRGLTRLALLGSCLELPRGLCSLWSSPGLEAASLSTPGKLSAPLPEAPPRKVAFRPRGGLS